MSSTGQKSSVTLNNTQCLIKSIFSLPKFYFLIPNSSSIVKDTIRYRVSAFKTLQSLRLVLYKVFVSEDLVVALDEAIMFMVATFFKACISSC